MVRNTAAIIIFLLVASLQAQISDTELKKLSKDDIIATMKHRQQLDAEVISVLTHQRDFLEQTISANAQALMEAKAAQNEIPKLKNEIEQLKKHDEDTTTRLNKANSALNWYRLRWWGSWIVFGLGVIVCILFFALKAAGKIAWNMPKL